MILFTALHNLKSILSKTKNLIFRGNRYYYTNSEESDYAIHTLRSHF